MLWQLQSVDYLKELEGMMSPWLTFHWVGSSSGMRCFVRGWSFTTKCEHIVPGRSVKANLCIFQGWSVKTCQTWYLWSLCHLRDSGRHWQTCMRDGVFSLSSCGCFDGTGTQTHTGCFVVNRGTWQIGTVNSVNKVGTWAIFSQWDNYYSNSISIQSIT